TRVTPSAGNKESGARYLRIRLGGVREVPKRAEQIFLIARQRYLRDGDIDGASRLLDESIRLAPAFARPYNYRAMIAADLGDREGALAWLQRALRADPDSWRTHRNLGRLFETLERYPEAEMHLRKTVQLFGDDAGAYRSVDEQGNVTYSDRPPQPEETRAPAPEATRVPEVKVPDAKPAPEAKAPDARPALGAKARDVKASAPPTAIARTGPTKV